ncbi:GNAT family N-acetyltransferase [Alteromonas sp. a30]|uniref:GNAT family N-acetyltransferase n=1 Tax=Alteromonas sp. a30 TaxID=2730917 RepID=UPI00228215BD|nr:GNAT family N-acetyltransferase [Alteromonas sp. a30]MCY7294740.1 GNAT family N-acetyltransferase [Alteromonas sp. a30]
MNPNLKYVDYNNPQHAKDLVYLLDHYAQDEMGGASPLKENVKQNLSNELAKRSFAFSFIAYVNNKPAGLINCFEGFSTFACKPLINIHDLVVHSDFRGQGLSRALIQSVCEEGKKRGCCKITLEVLTGNTVAYQAYRRFGFKPYELKPENGSATFMEFYL